MAQQQTGCHFQAEVTTVITAGTAVQLSAAPEHVQRLTVRGTAGNTGNVGFGKSDVSMSSATWILKPGELITLNFSPNTVPLSDFYVDADNNGDKLDWIVGAELSVGSGAQGAIAHSATTGKTATDHIAESTQAQMEAETAGDTRVAPDLVKYSPGVAKAWVSWNGTGTIAVRESYNITGVGDSGTGHTLVTIATDLSGAEPCIVLGGFEGVVTNDRSNVDLASIYDAGQFDVKTSVDDNTTGVPALTDFTLVSAAVFGDL